MTTLRHGAYMMQRHLLNLWRQPIWIAVTLVQPIVWLLLYGALFKNVTRIPGFHTRSYIQFLTPGIVIMSALFSAGWSGMAVIDDIDKGILDRFLVSPVKRGSLIVGRLMNGSFSLASPLEVAFSKASWTGPVSNEAVAITFKQHINATDALRTGAYSKTLTFTLSTTTP